MGSKKKRGGLRIEMKRLLANLDSEWVKTASEELCGRLHDLLASERLKERTRLLAWTSFFPGEVDLTPLISKVIQDYSVYLPRTLPDRSMNFISIGKNWITEIEPGHFGIPEPSDDIGKPYEPEFMAHESIVLVPGVAFDKFGNRLGRAKGYYDRFLGQSGLDKVIKIGIGWEFQIVPEIAVEPHDIPMDYLCHESGYIKTSLEDEEL